MFQTKMQEMEATLKTVSEEFTVLEQEETDLKSKEVDIKHEVEKYEVVYKENQQKVKHWKKELDKLSLQSVGLADDTPQQLETLTEEELETIDKEDIQVLRNTRLKHFLVCDRISTGQGNFFFEVREKSGNFIFDNSYVKSGKSQGILLLG